MKDLRRTGAELREWLSGRLAQGADDPDSQQREDQDREQASDREAVFDDAGEREEGKADDEHERRAEYEDPSHALGTPAGVISTRDSAAAQTSGGSRTTGSARGRR